jgi:hypothetical protein
VPPITDSKVDERRGRKGPRATFCTAEKQPAGPITTTPTCGNPMAVIGIAKVCHDTTDALLKLKLRRGGQANASAADLTKADADGVEKSRFRRGAMLIDSNCKARA